MSSAQHKRLAHYLIVSVWTCLGLACPPPLLPSAEVYSTDIAIPPDTSSVTIDISARVPQGQWRFAIRGVTKDEVKTDVPSAGMNIDYSPYSHNGYDDPSKLNLYALSCPKGFCTYQFAVRASSISGIWDVYTSFIIEEENEQHDGCDPANPNHADAEEVERLFRVEYRLSELMTFDSVRLPLPNDAGYYRTNDGGLEVARGAEPQVVWVDEQGRYHVRAGGVDYSAADAALDH